MKTTSTESQPRGIRRSWLAIGIVASCCVQGGAASVGVNVQSVLEESETLHTDAREGRAAPNLSQPLVDASILKKDRRMRIARIRELAAVEGNNRDFDAIFEESFEQMWRQMEGGMSMSPVRSRIDGTTFQEKCFWYSINSKLDSHTPVIRSMFSSSSKLYDADRIQHKLQWYLKQRDQRRFLPKYPSPPPLLFAQPSRLLRPYQLNNRHPILPMLQ